LKTHRITPRPRGNDFEAGSYHRQPNRNACALNISISAGGAEERFEEMLQDAAHDRLKPLYNFMNDLPSTLHVRFPLDSVRKSEIPDR